MADILTELQQEFLRVYSRLGAKHITFEVLPVSEKTPVPSLAVRIWKRRWKDGYSASGMLYVEQPAVNGLLYLLQEISPMLGDYGVHIEDPNNLSRLLERKVIPNMDMLETALKDWAYSHPGWRCHVELLDTVISITATVVSLKRCRTDIGAIRKFRYQPWRLSSSNVHPESAAFLLQNASTIIQSTIDIERTPR